MPNEQAPVVSVAFGWRLHCGAHRRFRVFVIAYVSVAFGRRLHCGLDREAERAQRVAERWEQIAARLDTQRAAHRAEDDENTAMLRKAEDALDGYAEAATCERGDFMEYAALRRADP